MTYGTYPYIFPTINIFKKIKQNYTKNNIHSNNYHPKLTDVCIVIFASDHPYFKRNMGDQLEMSYILFPVSFFSLALPSWIWCIACQCSFSLMHAYVCKYYIIFNLRKVLHMTSQNLLFCISIVFDLICMVLYI